ncbi:hypothetical protein BGX27_003835 [Mortierella sp. AM989]|nr:hypothetical protein BGX27_003835 [Mortierella sp. AM989]
MPQASKNFAFRQQESMHNVPFPFGSSSSTELPPLVVTILGTMQMEDVITHDAEQPSTPSSLPQTQPQVQIQIQVQVQNQSQSQSQSQTQSQSGVAHHSDGDQQGQASNNSANQNSL